MNGFAVGMAVGAFSVAHIYSADIKIIVHIFHRPGSDTFQGFLDIANEQRFGFIDYHCHSRVEALDVDYAVIDLYVSEYLLDFIRDVDKIECRRSFQIDDMVVDFHFFFLKA
jgi:hypothetical protein